jgi:hypothetical protein
MSEQSCPQGARPILTSETKDNDMSIEQAMIDTPEKHRATLFGERPAGSKWGRPFTLADWDALLGAWEQFTPTGDASKPGCRYFQASISEAFPDATLGALPYHEARNVSVAEGAHGPELHCVVPSGTHALRFKYATLILGEHEGREIVFTIHPGEPMAPWDGRMDGDTPIVTDSTAVKYTVE